MKKQIRRLSPHQNGKVFGILFAIATLPMLIPFFGMSLFVHGNDFSGPPMLMALTFPIIYLVFGYLSVAFGCFIYNLLYRFIGGFEFVIAEEDSEE